MTDFQAEAREALEADTPDSKALMKLMDFGITLDIDLPEMPKLKQVKKKTLLSFAIAIHLLLIIYKLRTGKGSINLR